MCIMRVNWIVVNIIFSLETAISNGGFTYSKYFARGGNQLVSSGFVWFHFLTTNMLLETFMNVTLNHNIRQKIQINFDIYLLNGAQYQKLF